MGTIVAIILAVAFGLMIVGTLVQMFADVFTFLLGLAIIFGLIAAGVMILGAGSPLGYVPMGIGILLLFGSVFGGSDD